MGSNKNFIVLSGLLILWRLFLSPISCFAQSSPLIDSTEMEKRMSSYFKAEKQESMLFMGCGAAALGTGASFLADDNDFKKGAAYPVISIGLIQLVVGSTVYFRTDRQVANLRQLLESDPEKFQRAELERMTDVNSGFDLYKMIEISFLTGSVAVIITGHNNDSDTLEGVGVGLGVQSAIMLALDLFAENRADRYTKHIALLQISAAKENNFGILYSFQY